MKNVLPFDLFEDSYSGSHDEYAGEHRAPSKGYKGDGTMPMYDLTDIYPDDIYSSRGADYYGDGSPFDQEAIRIIQSAKGKPEMMVKVYRAIPDFNADAKMKAKTLNKLVGYYNAHGFFPMRDKDPEGYDIVDPIRDLYPVGDEFTYDQQNNRVLADLYQMIEDIEGTMKGKKPDINPGDWVTICRAYAKDHGVSALNGKYTILTKTVKAKDLWTDGNSIHEWGYDPA